MIKVKFLGHSCFYIEGKDHKILIDPFLSGNPLAAAKPEELKVDTILLTHGHGDHLGDAVDIAKKNDATIIDPFELAVYCGNKGAKFHPMHIGGAFNFPFGRVKLTQATHGSGIQEGDTFIYAGNPCGFIFELDDKTLYHAGDTGLFGDMALIGERNSIDLAMVPIGDNFVMGVDDAAKATEFLKPKTVIPMHFDTFDVIKQDPEEFKSKAEKFAEVVIMNPGETFEL